MDNERLREMIAEYNEDAMIANGLDDAIIGMACRCGSEPVVAYDTNKVIASFVKEGMTEEEALEFFEFNVLGAYVGPSTPVYVTPFIAEEEK